MAVRHELFRCPGCDAADWDAYLLLPGGVVIACKSCGWQERIAEIDRRIREGEL